MDKPLDRLKGLMREKRVTYDMAARALTCSLGALSNKLNGKTEFTVSEIFALLGLLNLTSDDIREYFFMEETC
jgi:transcriptional regulator with XRE-family HTH domain